MKKALSKGKIAFIVVGGVVAVLLVYALVCCGITFVPMMRMAAINKTACGESAEPYATVELDNDVKLYAFPVGGAASKYVMICPGGGYVSCEIEAEGFCIAAELNRMGYSAFVLQYRVGKAITSYRAPLDDLARAIRYVDEHADQYNVLAGHYDLCGFSAGGNLVGLFGTRHCGYSQYEGVAAPNAILMGYPWINPHLPPSYSGNAASGVLASAFLDYKGNIADAAYYCSLTLGGANAFLGDIDNLEEMQVQRWITPDYPRTYFMHGDSDVIVPADTASDLFAQALASNGVDYCYKQCEGVGHGCGLGLGTSAEGWLAQAMAFADQAN